MPYETDIYDYSIKKLSDDGISFICERNFKTNETILKYKPKDSHQSYVKLICSKLG